MNNSNGGDGEVDDEIESAFAAGELPPTWRPRLMASGLSSSDVSVIAAAIAKTHPILRATSSMEAVAFNALGVLGGAFSCLVAVAVRDTKGLVMVVILFVLGVFFIVMTVVIALFDMFKRRRAKEIREVARTVLRKNLLSPV